MRGAWLVVPVKRPDTAKARLDGVLTPVERERLARRLAARTFGVVAAAPRPAGGGIAVVTGDAMVAQDARARGWSVIADPGIDHAAALRKAGDWVADRGASALITLATDLPALTTHDVWVLASLCAPRTCVLAPDRSGRGTNAIAVAPPRFPFAFGPGSFQRHTDTARQAGLTVRVLRLPGLAADLDEPSDLAML